MICFARSLAGHDRNKIYYIIEEKEDFYYLVNGKTSPFSKPKKKNRKHVQIIKKLPIDIHDVMMAEDKFSDQMIAKVIRMYEKTIDPADNN